MEFLSNYDENISMQSLFSGTSFLKLLEGLKEPCFQFQCYIEPDACKWTTRYLNYEQILQAVSEYFEKVLNKHFDYSSIDILELCKK